VLLCYCATGTPADAAHPGWATNTAGLQGMVNWSHGRLPASIHSCCLGDTGARPLHSSGMQPTCWWPAEAILAPATGHTGNKTNSAHPTPNDGLHTHSGPTEEWREPASSWCYCHGGAADDGRKATRGAWPVHAKRLAARAMQCERALWKSHPHMPHPCQWQALPHSIWHVACVHSQPAIAVRRAHKARRSMQDEGRHAECAPQLAVWCLAHGNHTSL
jgi:hypothetical protein